MQPTDNSRTDLVERALPWMIAGVALVLYIFTLNHWVTVASLQALSKVTQWDWWSFSVQSIQAPLFFLFTVPCRLVPQYWQPLMANLIAALCAAASLGLLARIVILLPHDRTHEQRLRERSEYSLLSIPAAWVPPVLAAAAAGLQLTFWEHATACTGEMLNLVLFAYVFRCLLEYRIDPRDSWMYQAVFVYALGFTNNWGMWPFILPLITAMVWIMGLQFFRIGFLSRCFGLALLGLCLYVVMPMVTRLSMVTDASFKDLLFIQLSLQWDAIWAFPRYAIFFCSLTSLLPMLIIGIRWPSSFGDISAMGVLLTNAMFRIVNGAFLIACVADMFDPFFSPRMQGYGVSLLPMYFLAAISIGYFSGYFLLVYGTEPERRRHAVSSGVRMFNRVVASLIWVALATVPAGLAVKNWSELKENNGPHLARFGERLIKDLPEKGAILMSDEPLNLLLIQAAYAKEQKANNHIMVDSRFLSSHPYHRSLNRRYPQKWPDITGLPNLPHSIPQRTMLQFMLKMSRSNQVFYLHPPLNIFAEAMEPRIRGLVFEMKPYSPGVVTNAPLSAEEIKQNLAFWAEVKADPLGMPRLAYVSERITAKSDEELIAPLYSRVANYFGTELQKQNLLKEAGDAFRLAKELNAENLVASINEQFNQNLAKQSTHPVEVKPDVEMRLKQKYRSWYDRQVENGPFDEPRFCNETGENMATFQPEPFLRQAALQFQRLSTLDSTNVEAQIWLANLYLRSYFMERTFETIQQIRKIGQKTQLSLAHQIELVRLEAFAHFESNNTNKAIQLLREEQVKNPGVAAIPETLANFYVKLRDYTNALAAIEQQLRLEPGKTKTLVNKGAINLRMKRYEDAIQASTLALEADPHNEAARINRAQACLNSGQLDRAKADYETLLGQLSPGMHYKIHFGLGEVAYLKKDSAAAAEYYEKFLKVVARSNRDQSLDEETIAMAAVARQHLDEIRSNKK